MEQCCGVDYVIGTVGRTDKILFKVLLEKIPEYTKMHPDKRFLLIFIGGPTVNKKVLERYNSDNLTIVNTGICILYQKKLIKSYL